MTFNETKCFKHRRKSLKAFIVVALLGLKEVRVALFLL